MSSSHPYAAPWRDRHGKLRWRFRHGKRTVYLPAAPGDPQFENAYQAALAGLPAPKTARVVSHPSSTVARSLKAAWRVYTTNFPEWMAASPATRAQQVAVAEEFLTSPIAEGAEATWGEMPVADLRRRHLRMILASMSDRPHAGRHRLVVIRKIILAALEEEWIEVDPSYRLTYRPATIAGFRAWTEDELAKFETRWPVGTTPRLVYELALWLGSRRCDLAKLRPADIRGDRAEWTQQKTGTTVVMPIAGTLRAALDVADLSGPTIVKTAYGKPFSIKSLTGRMRDWTHAAGLDGCTLHGLRKTLGKRIAESGGTTRQAMAALGHDTIGESERYSREAEREDLARQAMDKVVALVGSRRVIR